MCFFCPYHELAGGSVHCIYSDTQKDRRVNWCSQGPRIRKVDPGSRAALPGSDTYFCSNFITKATYMTTLISKRQRSATLPHAQKRRAGYTWWTVKIMVAWSHSPREGNGIPLQYSCLENPMDGEAWWAAVHGVAKSWARLSDFPFTFHFHALEKEMATHSSILA